MSKTPNTITTAAASTITVTPSPTSGSKGTNQQQQTNKEDPLFYQLFSSNDRYEPSELVVHPFIVRFVVNVNVNVNVNDNYNNNNNNNNNKTRQYRHPSFVQDQQK